MTQLEPSLLLENPLLGISKDATVEELELAARIDQLHQLIYTKGGLNSTNAAIEELSKIIFIKLCSSRHPEIFTSQGVDAKYALDNPRDNQVNLLEDLKKAFHISINESSFSLTRPNGSTERIWPTDEPFRIENTQVLAESVDIVNSIASNVNAVIDPLGTAFDAFLSGRYEHSGGLGTYLTPSSVARFMADLALRFAPSSHLRGNQPFLIDPFCGTGRFLVAGYQAIIDNHEENIDKRDLLEYGIFGADQSSSAISKSAINLLLYGATAPHVFTVSDSIEGGDLSALAGLFPMVLTNPPFGEGKYDNPQGLFVTKKYFPGVGNEKIDPALGGLARSLELLCPGGVLGIVLPDGVINGRHFKSAAQQGRLNVVASVSLPVATFALSGTVARTSAVFIKKTDPSSHTLLARAEHVGFIRKSGKAARDPEGSDLQDIAKWLQKIDIESDGEEFTIFSSKPLVAKVKKNSIAGIDPSRFDSESLDARSRLAAEGGDTLGVMCTTRPKCRPRGDNKSSAFVSVLHVDSYGTVDWVEAESYAPVTPGQVAFGGDLIISLLNPSKLRATVIPESYNEVECSAEFGVIDQPDYPYAVLALLYHPLVSVQLRPLGSGTSSSRRRITIRDVLNLTIPSKSEIEMAKLDQETRKQVDAIGRARRSLHSAYNLGSEIND